VALAYSSYAWSPITAGVRTPIFKGPLWHGAPVQWLLFARPAAFPPLPSVPLTFTVWFYSAAAPWYTLSTGAATAWKNFAIPVPAGAFNPLPTVDIQKAPWDAGFPIWALGSPWAEFHVTSSINCMASIFVP